MNWYEKLRFFFIRLFTTGEGQEVTYWHEFIYKKNGAKYVAFIYSAVNKKMMMMMIYNGGTDTGLCLHDHAPSEFTVKMMIYHGYLTSCRNLPIDNEFRSRAGAAYRGLVGRTDYEVYGVSGQRTPF